MFQGVKEPKRVPPTVPESPAFTLKHRARIPVVEEPQVNKDVMLQLVWYFLHLMVDCSFTEVVNNAPMIIQGLQVGCPCPFTRD